MVLSALSALFFFQAHALKLNAIIGIETCVRKPLVETRCSVSIHHSEQIKLNSSDPISFFEKVYTLNGENIILTITAASAPKVKKYGITMYISRKVDGLWQNTTSTVHTKNFSSLAMVSAKGLPIKKGEVTTSPFIDLNLVN